MGIKGRKERGKLDEELDLRYPKPEALFGQASAERADEIIRRFQAEEDRQVQPGR